MSMIDLLAKLQSSFDNARNAGDLYFFPSTVVTHNDSGIEYEIRLCPALQHKPTADADVAATQLESKVFDPFAPPYNANLHVGDLKDEVSQEEYAILLNKYSVVSQHFLLVTKEFQSQALPPLPSELLQTYLLLSTARKLGKKFFAFYNCGNNSGASQPHKHIQFIPLDSESQDGPPIDRLARQVHVEIPEKPFSLHQLSYVSHSYRFPPHLDTYPSDRLQFVVSDAFFQLIDCAISAIRRSPDYPVGKPSYNVIITLEYMHVIPRRQDGYVLEETGEKLSVNALGFAGMLLTKSEEEVEAVKRESVSKILQNVGLESVPPVDNVGCDEP